MIDETRSLNLEPQNPPVFRSGQPSFGIDSSPQDRPTDGNEQQVLEIIRACFPNKSEYIRVRERKADTRAMRANQIRVVKASLNALVWCLAAGVLVENLIVVRENRALEFAVDAATTDIPVAAQIRNVAAISLEGRIEPIVVPLTGDSSPLLIVTFSPGCPACLANQASWEKLAREIHQTHTGRVLWISRDPLEITLPYCSEHRIDPSEVLADPPYRTFTQLALRQVPKTIIVGADGRVERVWSGLLNDSLEKDVAKSLGIKNDSVSSTAH